MFKFSKKEKIIDRVNCYPIKIGDITIGGFNNIAIQSMTTVKTSNIDKCLEQINSLFKAGADLVRISVLDIDDANSLKEIINKIKKPLIADIHFNKDFAITAIQTGIAKIRINPNNISSQQDVSQIIQEAKKHNTVIRIGINEGSIKDNTNISKNEVINSLINQMKQWIKFFEKNQFFNLVLSIKHSDPELNTKVNEKLATISKYPIHLGLTEAGDKDRAIIKSCISLVPLLNKKIGNTIRISINGDPLQEVYVAKILLNQMQLLPNYANLIACPLCGRNQYETSKWVQEISQYIKDLNMHITIGIMGCVVNGIGEAKNCDISVCVIDKNTSRIFYKNKVAIDSIKNENVVNTLKTMINEEYKKYYAK